MAAKSLAEPLEACRPQEGLKSRSSQAPGDTWQGHSARTPQGGLHSRRKILGVQSRLARLGEHTDLRRSRIQGAQLGWCQMVRSGQPRGVLIPMVYLFGGEESKAMNSKVAHKYAEHREHIVFILVRASGE
jgi:hypothetical protein